MIAIGSDHGGFALKQDIMKHLDELGLAYKDYGTYTEASCDYPVYGEAVARAVAGGEAEKRISTVKEISNNCGLDVNYQTVDEDVTNACKTNETKLGVWTLPDKELKRFLKLKVDYITLDN